MDVEVKIEGMNELMKDLADSGANSKRLVTSALANSSNKIQSEARKRAPHRTGSLQRSILAYLKYPLAIVQVNEKYGVYIEQGTGIYGPEGRPIRPVKAKVLVFKIGGRTIFTKEIKGIRAKPFFAPGIQASQTYVSQQFTRVIDLMVKGLAGKGYQ